jgi:hypothetical protein
MQYVVISRDEFRFVGYTEMYYLGVFSTKEEAERCVLQHRSEFSKVDNVMTYNIFSSYLNDAVNHHEDDDNECIFPK